MLGTSRMTHLRRLSVSLKRTAAVKTTRVALGKNKLVYILVANKKLDYPNGRTQIAYIGTTKRGLSRIAGSVARRADQILSLRGVTSFDAKVVICKPRQRVKTWHKLERAFLITFRQIYGDVPQCNKQGTKMKETDEFRYFARCRIKRILEDLS